MHENAHNSFLSEKRNNVIISRGMAVSSRALGVSGECDVVEFYREDTGVTLFGREGLWQVFPVEYKRGIPKVEDCDRVQLTAQAMCLEEMFVCDVPYGFLYYEKIRRRERVEFTTELRELVTKNFTTMHKYANEGYTPRVKRTPKCAACSLADICLPRLAACKSAKAYVSSHADEEGEI